MAIVLGGEANKKDRPSDKDAIEPVNFNELFRKAKRNSLLWSTVAILTVLGVPVDRKGTVADEAVIAVFPLGFGFEQWMLVAFSTVIATYMYVGFDRSLHSLTLINAARIRQRGLDDVPSAMKEITVQISRVSEQLKTASDQIAKVGDTAAQFANENKSKLKNRKSKIEQSILEEVQKIVSLSDRALSLVPEPLPGQAVTKDQIYRAFVQRADSIHNTKETALELASRLPDIIDQLISPLPHKKRELSLPDLGWLEVAVSDLTNAASELTEFERTIDKTDKAYLRNFDFMPTAVLFCSAVMLGLGFLGAQWWTNGGATWLSNLNI